MIDISLIFYFYNAHTFYTNKLFCLINTFLSIFFHKIIISSFLSNKLAYFTYVIELGDLFKLLLFELVMLLFELIFKLL